jgi:hemerythrin superfamily protein
MATRSETTTKSTKSGQRKESTRAGAGDALELLKADHRKVEELFSEFESARKPERKEELAQTICQELSLHAALEESSFYPAVRAELGDDEELLNEAAVEHESLKWLISQIEDESVDGELFEAKVMVLKEYVQHHVKEEEKEMFPKIRQSNLDTVELGEVLKQVKQELQTKEVEH